VQKQTKFPRKALDNMSVFVYIINQVDSFVEKKFSRNDIISKRSAVLEEMAE